MIFSDFPEEIIVDSTVSTTLNDEYLLNEEGFLEIQKVYRNGKCVSTNINAKHPINDDTVKNLLLKKIQELRSIVESKNIVCENRSAASALRKSIRDSYDSLVLDEILIPVDKDGLKQIWDQLQKYIPVYALFQADRSNNDSDTEVQDPLKIAVKEAVKLQEIQEKLHEVAERVREISREVADSTLNKLKELNPDIANQLNPNIPKTADLKWFDVFKNISITSDDDVPLNKRGSGVRRLVLISFFLQKLKEK